MRSGFYQSTLGGIPVFEKRFGLLFLLCGILLCGFDVRAQAPNLISFQGVARDENGKIKANDWLQLIFHIHSGAPAGPIIGTENVVAQTNSSGIFTHIVGSTSLKLGLINWSSGPYYLEVLMDSPALGSFVSMGTTQITSVPYALHAMEAAKLADNLPIVLKGTLGSSDPLSASGAGTRMIWHPRNGAFRTGTVTANQWDNNEIGINSFGAGQNVVSKGDQSVAMGENVIAKAKGGIALGLYNNNNDNPNNSGSDRILQVGNGISDGSRRNALTILRNARMGIGEFAVEPDYLLDVSGRMRIQHRNNETAGIHLNTSTNALGSFIGMKADDQVGFFMGSNWWFWVNSQGDGFLKGNIIQTSDRRLKRDFSPVTNSLSKLTNITGQHYFWKDSTKSQALQTGLIAQEVEQYFPELVTTDEKGFKAVNYIGLIPHLIESVKTLKAQTETIGALEKKLESFTARETLIRDEIKASLLRELRSELSNIKATSNSNRQSK